jgi:hypothetical protein
VRNVSTIWLEHDTLAGLHAARPENIVDDAESAAATIFVFLETQIFHASSVPCWVFSFAFFDLTDRLNSGQIQMMW